jgi:uncharacterized protein
MISSSGLRNSAMLDLKPIVHAVLKEYALEPNGTHGVAHWARVLENGLRLAEETGASVDVVQLFAVFHDSRRMNESCDPGHGRRGAELAATFRDRWFVISDHDFDLLYDACVRHTDGETEADPTVQTCWDADRLDLGRVGIRPNCIRLCTEAAKRADVIHWADGRATLRAVPEIVRQGWDIG